MNLSEGRSQPQKAAHIPAFLVLEAWVWKSTIVVPIGFDCDSPTVCAVCAVPACRKRLKQKLSLKSGGSEKIWCLQSRVITASLGYVTTLFRPWLLFGWIFGLRVSVCVCVSRLRVSPA